jgi:transcriptional regulator
MYTPKAFIGSDEEGIALMRGFPFALLLSLDEHKEPSLSHLPLLTRVNPETGKVTLVGHMAKRNPQWRHFLAHPKAKAVFNGPHAYISPKWYVSGRDVPTWSYAACHVSGAVKLIEDFEGLVSLLKELSEFFEGSGEDAWSFFLPDDLADPRVLTSAIVGFEIEVESIETKMKFSQTRSVEDQNGVIAGLRAAGGGMNEAVAALMER